MGTKNKPKESYILHSGRIDTFLDFIINLTNYIVYYYVDGISTEKEIRSHYDWCFDKVCDDFFLEGLYFYDNNELREYFYDYYKNQFYLAQGNDKYNKTVEYYNNFWIQIFNVKQKMTNTKIKILIELYKIFNKSVNNKKSIFNF